MALARGTARAEEHCLDGRIEWLHADLRTWAPSEAAFDLVTAQYMHLPAADREPLFDRLAAAVAPGGTLLIVGHLVDAHDAAHHGRPPDMFFTAEEIAAALDPTVWEVLVTDTRLRPDDHAAGRPVEDAVLRARRRPAAERSRLRAVDRETYDDVPVGSRGVERPSEPAARRRGQRPARRHGAGRRARRGRRRTLAGGTGLARDRGGLLSRRAGAGGCTARDRGLDDRITWLHADLDEWTSGEERFDLVTAHYLHSRGADRTALFQRLAGAVAPGGTLLVVGHLLGEASDDHHHGDEHTPTTPT